MSFFFKKKEKPVKLYRQPTIEEQVATANGFGEPDPKDDDVAWSDRVARDQEYRVPMFDTHGRSSTRPGQPPPPPGPPPKSALDKRANQMIKQASAPPLDPYPGASAPPLESQASAPPLESQASAPPLESQASAHSLTFDDEAALNGYSKKQIAESLSSNRTLKQARRWLDTQTPDVLIPLPKPPGPPPGFIPGPPQETNEIQKLRSEAYLRGYSTSQVNDALTKENYNVGMARAILDEKVPENLGQSFFGGKRKRKTRKRMTRKRKHKKSKTRKSI